MTFLRPVTYQLLQEIVEAAGFRRVGGLGIHNVFAHPDGRSVVVPDHGPHVIVRPLLRKILRDTGLGAVKGAPGPRGGDPLPEPESASDLPTAARLSPRLPIDEASPPMPVVPKRWIGPYDRGLCSEQPPETLLAGIAQFNRGEYFEQHETIEILWRRESDDVRYLYQGILLVGVGLYHWQRGNHRGAVSRLMGGLDKLRWFLPSCQGIDVQRLVEETTRCLESLIDLGPARMGELDRELVPRVQVLSQAGNGEGC